MVRLVIIFLALIGTLAFVPMVFPSVWGVAFSISTLHVKYIYLILALVLYFGLKLKMGK